MSTSLIFNFWYTPSVCCSFIIYVYARTPFEQPSLYRCRRHCTNCTVSFSLVQFKIWATIFLMCEYSCVCVCERPLKKSENINHICLKYIEFKVRSKVLCSSSPNSCITWVIESHPVILSVFYAMCFWVNNRSFFVLRVSGNLASSYPPELPRRCVYFNSFLF